jgi:hypothetical protein
MKHIKTSTISPYEQGLKLYFSQHIKGAISSYGQESFSSYKSSLLEAGKNLYTDLLTENDTDTQMIYTNELEATKELFVAEGMKTLSNYRRANQEAKDLMQGVLKTSCSLDAEMFQDLFLEGINLKPQTYANLYKVEEN